MRWWCSAEAAVAAAKAIACDGRCWMRRVLTKRASKAAKLTVGGLLLLLCLRLPSEGGVC